MIRTNTYAFFLFIALLASCSKVDYGDVKTIKIGAINISEYEIFPNPSDQDSLEIDIIYTDPALTASYFVLSDTRYGFITPRYYQVPPIPADLDLSGGMQGVLHVRLPLTDIKVEDTFPQERFNYRVTIFSLDSDLHSEPAYSDSITVYR